MERRDLRSAGGGARTALVVHGASLSAQAYEPLAARLGGRVVGLDLTGHGRVGTQTAEHPWDAFRKDIVSAVCDTAEETSGAIDVVAHSAGAAAVALALRAEDLPIRELVLFEPAARPGDAPADPRFIERTVRRRAKFPTRAAAREYLMGRKPFADFTAEALDGFIATGTEVDDPGGEEVRLACRPEFEGRIYEEAPASGAWDALCAIDRPVILVRGDADPDDSLADAASLAAESMTDARVVQISGVGHFAPCTHPSLVAEYISTIFEGAAA